MGFLIVSILVLAVIAALLLGEIYGLRQSVDRLRRSEEQANAEFTGWFRVLEGAVMDCVKEDTQTAAALEELWVTLDGMKDRMTGANTAYITHAADIAAALSRLEDSLAALTVRAEAEDAARARLTLLAVGLEELRKTVPEQGETMRQLREDVGKLSHELGLLAMAGGQALVGPPSDMDSQLSKAMEEGVMNLMQYAAGKTSGGVEVGLG